MKTNPIAIALHARGAPHAFVSWIAAVARCAAPEQVWSECERGHWLFWLLSDGHARGLVSRRILADAVRGALGEGEAASVEAATTEAAACDAALTAWERADRAAYAPHHAAAQYVRRQGGSERDIDDALRRGSCATVDRETAMARAIRAAVGTADGVAAFGRGALREVRP